MDSAVWLAPLLRVAQHDGGAELTHGLLCHGRLPLISIGLNAAGTT